MIHAPFVLFLAHGTFVGSIRVDPHKPVQVLVDTTLCFGASTRRFTLRERPNAQSSLKREALKASGEDEAGSHSLLGLPEEDTELDVCKNLSFYIAYNVGRRKALFMATVKVDFKDQFIGYCLNSVVAVVGKFVP